MTHLADCQRNAGRAEGLLKRCRANYNRLQLESTRLTEVEKRKLAPKLYRARLAQEHAQGEYERAIKALGDEERRLMQPDSFLKCT